MKAYGRLCALSPVLVVLGTAPVAAGTGDAPGKLTEAEAIPIVKAFFDRCGLRMPADRPIMAARSETTGATSSLTFRFANGAEVTVSARNRSVSTLSNRRSRIPWRKAPLGMPISSLVTARKYGLAVLTRIGLPEGFQPIEVKMRKPISTSPYVNGGDYPTYTISCQNKPNGYRLWNGFGKRSVVVDPRDGTLLYYTRHPDWPYTVNTGTPKLTLGQAKELAAPVAKKNRLRESGPSESKKSELMYVRPNAELGGVSDARRGQPAKLRLAWVIPYASKCEGWIDAVDGRLLGGTVW